MPENSANISLEVTSLALHRTSVALGPASFSLPHAGCWWLAGVSGAGKSLLMESLAGFHAETEGSVRVCGAEVANLAPERRSIALMPQRWRLFPHLNALQNLRYAAKLGAASVTRVDALCSDLAIAPLLKRPARELSGGEAQRIALVQTLLSPARILLLDEPFSAMDSALQTVAFDLLQAESAAHSRICLVAAHRPVAGYPLQGTLWIERGKLVPEDPFCDSYGPGAS